jgi:hypothetical protein
MLPVTRIRSAGTPSERKALRVLVRLHGEEVDVGEHACDQAAARVRALRLRRHLAVDDRDRGAAPMRDADEVRPELRLGDDHEPRIEACHGSAHDER